ncbi:MAG: DUF4404 family protein [Oleiphilaceae bacterium]|nr:DUF4404 family protein [Oleiphilaceae bacterium]
MPRQKAAALIGELHERFGDAETSDQQKELMARLEAHIHELGEKDPVEPSFIDAMELLLAEIETDHPKAAAVTRQLLETLRNIGV